MHKPILLSTIASIILPLYAQPLTEAAAVLRALENNPDIRVEKLTLKQENHTLQSVKSEGGLQAVIEAPLTYTAGTIQAPPLSSDSTSETTTASVNGSVSRLMPGGGTAVVQASEGMNAVTSDSTNYETELTLSYSQPLLKGFGKNNTKAHNIRIQKNRYKISREEFSEELANKLSRVREAYWRWFAASALAEIRRQEVEYAGKEIAYQRARFRLGEISVMDTLGAHVEWLKAKGTLAEAEQGAKNTRHELAVLLDINAAALERPSSFEIAPSSIQSLADALRAAEEEDAELKKINILRENINRQLAYDKNRKLPALDLTVSHAVEQAGDQFLGSAYGSAANATVGLLLTWDILHRKEKHAAEITEIEVQKQRILEETYRKQLKNTIENLFDTWTTDTIRYALQVTEEQKARQFYEAVLQESDLGAVDQLTRIKAKNDLVDAQIGKLNRAIKLKQIEIAVDEATKNIFPKFGVNQP